MAIQTVQLSSQKSCEDVRELRSTINLMDLHSQASVESISAVAHLALVAIQRPETLREPGTLKAIAQALTTIRDEAEELMNGINAAAERVGCNFVAQPRRRPDAGASEACKAKEAVHD